MAESVVCGLCPHHCSLAEGAIGYCRARANHGGRIVSLNYGCLTALAMDPIEKKPLRRFHPHSFILSVGSFGCNMRCPFCQNYTISQQGRTDMAGHTRQVLPDELVGLAGELHRSEGNLGVAFTYNEPLVGYEYVYDCAVKLKEAGLAVVLVTNGQIEPEPLARLLPFVDAMNIDIKGFSEDFYRWAGGSLACARATLEAAVGAGVHVEATTLVIPGRNDSMEDMVRETGWLASLSPDIPLHLSRYFPRYQLRTDPTPRATLQELSTIARRRLKYVYLGNI